MDLYYYLPIFRSSLDRAVVFIVEYVCQGLMWITYHLTISCRLSQSMDSLGTLATDQTVDLIWSVHRMDDLSGSQAPSTCSSLHDKTLYETIISLSTWPKNFSMRDSTSLCSGEKEKPVGIRTSRVLDVSMMFLFLSPYFLQLIHCCSRYRRRFTSSTQLPLFATKAPRYM